jgi:ribosomal protein S18 acetylase RimI-like enzyme
VQFGPLQIQVQGAADDDKAMDRLYVLPELQGKGVGSGLLDAALRHPLLADASRVYLDVWDQNLGARRLYERNEFRVVGENSYTVDGGVVWHDLVMMRPHP